MSDNLLSLNEDERDGIEIVTLPGADRPKAQCPICARRVPGFELAKLSESKALERGAKFACGHCRSQWLRETE